MASAFRIGREQIGQLRRAKLPFLALWVGGATVVACIGVGSFMGFQSQGLAWFVTLLLAMPVAFKQASKISFPLRIWLPWALVVVLWEIAWPYPNGLQRSVMLLCPIVVGVAVSSFPLSAEKIAGLPILMRLLATALWVVVLFNTGLAVTGRLPASTALAPQAITGILLCTYFAAAYGCGRKDALPWWGLIALVPFIALTRMAILAAGATLPMTLAPLGLRKRVALFATLAVLGIMAFYTPRLQEKMFRSGHGTLEELSLSNPDLQTSGRTALWAILEAEIAKAPWLGHGSNASEKLVRQVTGSLTHPHNDWLRLRYDYGLIGTGVFVFCALFQMLYLWRRARKARGDVRILLYGGAASFIPFAMMMYTDNIILYVAYYGNLQFALIGLGCSALRNSETDGLEEGGSGPVEVRRVRRAAPPLQGLG